MLTVVNLKRRHASALEKKSLFVMFDKFYHLQYLDIFHFYKSITDLAFFCCLCTHQLTWMPKWLDFLFCLLYTMQQSLFSSRPYLSFWPNEMLLSSFSSWPFDWWLMQRNASRNKKPKRQQQQIARHFIETMKNSHWYCYDY